MKKLFTTIITIISVITLTSCNNNSKQQHLIEMRDSIQSEISWKQEAIEKEFQYLDSLYNTDKDSYGMFHEFSMKTINDLQKRIDKENEQLFQIELQLNK